MQPQSFCTSLVHGCLPIHAMPSSIPWTDTQAEALDRGSSSILYGVRLPEDMPPGVAYLEVEQGPFVSVSTPVLVMPPQRFMAAAEVLQLLRGSPIAAAGLALGEQPVSSHKARG